MGLRRHPHEIEVTKAPRHLQHSLQAAELHFPSRRHHACVLGWLLRRVIDGDAPRYVGAAAVAAAAVVTAADRWAARHRTRVTSVGAPNTAARHSTEQQRRRATLAQRATDQPPFDLVNATSQFGAALFKRGAQRRANTGEAGRARGRHQRLHNPTPSDDHSEGEA